MTLRWLWLRLWAGPVSLLGLLLVPFFRRRSVTAGIVLGEGAGWPRRLGWNYSAITLGHVVLSVDDPIAPETLEHELVHVRQYERYGLLFPIAYGLASLAAKRRGGHYYSDNRFEIAARTARFRRSP